MPYTASKLEDHFDERNKDDEPDEANEDEDEEINVDLEEPDEANPLLDPFNL